MEKIVLSFPVTLADGRELKEIHLRRPKVRDLKAAQNAAEDATGHEVVLVAALSEERLVPEDIEELDLADYAQIQAFLRRIQGRKD